MPVGVTFNLLERNPMNKCYNGFVIQLFRFAVRFSGAHMYCITRTYCTMLKLSFKYNHISCNKIEYYFFKSNNIHSTLKDAATLVKTLRAVKS